MSYRLVFPGLLALFGARPVDTSSVHARSRLEDLMQSLTRGVWVLLLLLLLSLGQAAPAQATSFFVDFTGGLNTNNGTSSGTAWKDLTKVNATTFVAGDLIQFKRGETFTGTLTINNSGTSGNPIRYTAYGTGAAPILQSATTHQTSGDTHAIEVNGDWNVIEQLLIRNGHEAALIINPGGDNNVVQDNELTAAGVGVYIYGGATNLVQRNSVHDLFMIVNDSTANNDRGAVCFWIELNAAVNNKILGNTGINCRAASLDYGFDGGFVEFYNGGDATEVAYNWIQGTDGIVEFGGSGTANHANNVVFHHNVVFEAYNGWFCLHLTGTFPLTITNFKIENNTLYKQATTDGNRQFDCAGSDLSMVVFRNNVVVSNLQMANVALGTHTNNRYYMVNMVNGSGVGYTLGTGETTGDPLLVDPATANLHLQSGSVARDMGAVLGYTQDYDGIAIPQNGIPDLGAYEFVVATGTPPILLHLLW